MPPAKGRKIVASRKKKQTRLTFEAVDLTSSPASTGPSPAKVRYAKSSTSRSTKTIPSSSVQDESESDDPILSSAVLARSTPSATIPKQNGKLPFQKRTLPTPSKSSQMPGARNRSTGTLEDSVDDVARSSFAPWPSRNSAPKPFSGKTPFAQKSSFHIDGDSSDGSLSENAYTPTKPKGKGKGKKSVDSITKDGDEEVVPTAVNSGRLSRMEIVITSPKSNTATGTPSKTKPQRSKETVTISSANSEDEEENEISKPQKVPAAVPRSSRNSARKKPDKYVELLSSSDSEEFEVPLSLPPKRHGLTPKKPTLFSNVPKSKSSSPIPAPASSDNEFPSTRKLIMNGTKKLLFSSVPKGKSSSPAQEGKSEEDDSDEDVVMSTQPSRRKRPAVLISDPVDDDEEVQMSSPLKRRRPAVESDDSDIASSPLKRKRPNPMYSEDEEDDLPTESNDFQPPTATQQTRATRQSRRRHRTEKEKTLELLKRRRAGEHIEELTETEESESDDDSGSELQKLSEFEDEEEEEEVVAMPKKPVQKNRQKKARSGSDEDHYDSDFIEDDDDGNLGVPTHSLLDIPLEFTHAAHKPLKEHFKDAIEWMVHAKINPAFARDDPVYMAAFRKLDDEYGGYAKSKFVSTQWTPEFVRAIYARPELLVRDLEPGEEITIAGEVICQVCNHRKYVPKYEIQFAGKAYHLDSLEEVEQDDSSDDSDGASKASQKRSVNADGQVIPSEDRCWLSGRFCKANAEQAHSLIHWKYALNQWVLGNLEHEGYLTPGKLAEREKLKSKQRRKYANDIVDEWESHRQIKDLYRDFKINLETARNTDAATFRNGRFGR